MQMIMMMMPNIYICAHQNKDDYLIETQKGFIYIVYYSFWLRRREILFTYDHKSGQKGEMMNWVLFTCVYIYIVLPGDGLILLQPIISSDLLTSQEKTSSKLT